MIPNAIRLSLYRYERLMMLLSVRLESGVPSSCGTKFPSMGNTHIMDVKDTANRESNRIALKF